MIGRLAGSGRQPKLTAEVLALVEAKMRSNNKATAVHLVKHLKENGFDLSKTSAIHARTLLGWTYHGSRYCQLIRHANKEKRVAWVQKHFDDSFEDVIWTDESSIQLENYRTFSYRKKGEPPKQKAKPKHPYKVMVWAGISKQGATNIAVFNTTIY